MVLFFSGEVCDPSEYVEHPWDECACAGQFFSNEDCTEAFYCADEDSNLGCHLICPDGQASMRQPNQY